MRHTVSLNRNRDFQRIYKRGKSAVGGLMVIYCRPNRGETAKLGLTVSTKLGGAVHRNRIRRRLKECYRGMETQLKPGFDIVIVARSRSHSAPFALLTREMQTLLKRLHIAELP